MSGESAAERLLAEGEHLLSEGRLGVPRRPAGGAPLAELTDEARDWLRDNLLEGVAQVQL